MLALYMRPQLPACCKWLQVVAHRDSQGLGARGLVEGALCPLIRPPQVQRAQRGVCIELRYELANLPVPGMSAAAVHIAAVAAGLSKRPFGVHKRVPEAVFKVHCADSSK